MYNKWSFLLVLNLSLILAIYPTATQANPIPNGLTATDWFQIQSLLPTEVSSNSVIKISANDIAIGDQFGTSVGVDGDTVVVGAHYNDDDGENSGSAYIFVRSGTTWSQQAKLTAHDASAIDHFGYSSAISGDTVVVSAVGDDNFTGSVYVFVRSGTTWSQQAKLTASDANHFGASVAVTGDTAVIGAPRNDDHGGDSGSAYIFTRSGTTWSQQAKLTADDASAGDVFGLSVAIFEDTAIVGAYWDDPVGMDSGSAYVFVRSGTTWSQQAKLIASDAAADEWFGRNVAIYEDTAVVTTYNDWYGDPSGEAYVFVRSGTTWSEQARLTASDEALSFGSEVAIFGDTLLIGAHFDNMNRGSAYLFVRSGTTWSEQAKLTADDAQNGDQFAESVALDGDTIIIGSIAHFNGNYGSAYIFVDCAVSANSGNWNNALTWQGGEVPNSTDNVCINSEHTVTLTEDVHVKNLRVNEGGVFNLSTYNLTVEGNVINNGTLQQSKVMNNTAAEFLHIQNLVASDTKYRGIWLNSASTNQNLGMTTVSIQELNEGEFCTNSGATSPVYAKRCYRITPTTQPNAEVSLRLYARTDDELEGIIQDNLRIYHWDGSWQPQYNNVSTGSNGIYSYSQADVISFSPFLLGGVNAPTNVLLHTINTAVTYQFTLIQLIVGFLSFTTLVILIWHRKNKI